MAVVPDTDNVYTGDGTTTQFAVTFPYLKSTDVKASVDEVPVSITFAAAGLVNIVPAPANGAVVRVYRDTPAEVVPYVFSEGVPFLTRYADFNWRKILYALQEIPASITKVYNDVVAIINNQVAYLINQISLKQDTLVSGSNIKTINSESILGPGNLVLVKNSFANRAALAASSLSVGQLATTAGCNTEGDGGGGLFLVKPASGVPDGYSSILLANGNHAVLQRPYRVRQFGVTGNGTNEREKVQLFFDVCCAAGQSLIDIEELQIAVNGPIYIRPTSVTTSSDVGSDIHFMHEMPRLQITSSGNGRIYALNAMASLVEFSVFTPSGAGSYANFYTFINNLFLDGAGLVTAAVLKINSAMHVEVTRCIIEGGLNCISNNGYGVHKVHRNVLRSTGSVIEYQGGGDSFFEHNDIYINNNQIGIKLRPFAGSTLINRNTFTPIDVSTTDSGCTAIQLAAYEAGDDTKAMGAVIVSNNCFDGMKWGVHCKGFSAANRNVKGVDIYGNYVGCAGTVNQVNLFWIQNSQNVLIHDNRCGVGYDEPTVNSLGIVEGSYSVDIYNEKVIECNAEPIIFDNSDTCSVHDCRIESGGLTAGVGACYIRLRNNTFRVSILRNKFWQVHASAARIGIIEETGSTVNYADYNDFFGAYMALINHYVLAGGSSSVFRSRINQASAPVSGTWLVGAINTRLAPTAGGFLNDVCVTAGTPGTWKTANPISA